MLHLVLPLKSFVNYFITNFLHIVYTCNTCHILFDKRLICTTIEGEHIISANSLHNQL